MNRVIVIKILNRNYCTAYLVTKSAASIIYK